MIFFGPLPSGGIAEFLRDNFCDFGRRRLGSARAIMSCSFLTSPERTVGTTNLAIV